MTVRHACCLIALLAACSLDVDAPDNPIPGATTVNVAIGDFFYNPDTIQLARGGSVVWTNNGFEPHTTTSDALYWDSKAIPSPGTGAINRYARQFQSVGTFPYHCELHPADMAGVVIVTP